MNRSDKKEGSADLKYGLIVYPVSHSMSPSIFGAVFSAACIRARYGKGDEGKS